MCTFLTETLRQARNAWMARHLDSEAAILCGRNGIGIESSHTGDKESSWGDWKWHVKNRLTSSDLDSFLNLFPEFRGKEDLLREYLSSFDLSLLPLNLLQHEGVRKFLPRLGLKPAPDPYGVQRANSVVLRDGGHRKFYLATHKPGYASFLPILGRGAGRVSCPIGCAGCYRGPQTRFQEPLRVIHKDGRSETVWIPQPVQQTAWLVQEWNTRPEFSGVYDILFSGGEPMLLSNNVWRSILNELKTAKYLRSFRICTGALFLGLPFRFDEEFVRLLTGFRDETGVQIKLSAHVSHPEHVTPESAHFARQLINAGIELLPQCPLEPGVNFWIDDLDRTEKTLRQLDRLLALVIGTRSYKWILDMQGGVPLISAIELWRRVHDRHQTDSDIARPTSFALLLPRAEGNLNLSFHSLWAIEMDVIPEEGIVRYKIPHPAGTWIEYEEPLCAGINDDPSHLETLRLCSGAAKR